MCGSHFEGAFYDGGEVMLLECETTGHIASVVRKQGGGEFVRSFGSKVTLNVTKLTMKVNLYTPSLASFPQLTLPNNPLMLM